MDNWQVKRKKRKRGPHDSRQRMNIYFSIYNKIFKHRQNRDANRYWQKLFFLQYFSNKQNEDDNNDDESCKDTGMKLYFAMMPGIHAEIDGYDDNGVVSYSVQFRKKKKTECYLNVCKISQLWNTCIVFDY